MRMRATAEGMVPFTPEEEAAFDAELAERLNVQPKPKAATEILQNLDAAETEKLLDLLLLREVITPERAEKLKGK
jgi:hypothetical protein